MSWWETLENGSLAALFNCSEWQARRLELHGTWRWKNDPQDKSMLERRFHRWRQVFFHWALSSSLEIVTDGWIRTLGWMKERFTAQFINKTFWFLQIVDPSQLIRFIKILKISSRLSDEINSKIPKTNTKSLSAEPFRQIWKQEILSGGGKPNNMVDEGAIRGLIH